MSRRSNWKEFQDILDDYGIDTLYHFTDRDNLESIIQNGQANKSAGRMPWHQEPMKDVVSCEKLRGVASKL